MSTLDAAGIRGPSIEGRRRSRSGLLTGRSVILLPLGLALAYLIVLVVRYPQVIVWQNDDSDIASSFQLAEALLHGHTGAVQFATQGSWIELGWQLLTAGLAGHRLLWELFAPGLGVVTVLLIGWGTARVRGSLAGVLAAALVVATSPDGLKNLISAPWHNTSTLGAAALAIYAVWLNSARRTLALAFSAIAMSLVCGTFLACDHLLAIIGLIPFLVAAGVASTGAERPRIIAVSLIVAVGSAVVSGLLSAFTRSLGLFNTTPGLWPASGRMVIVHLRWMYQGLLRLGNGPFGVPRGPLTTALVYAAGTAVAAGLAAMVWVTVQAIRRRRCDRPAATHAVYWCATTVSALLAYVLTNAAYEPSDRYFFVVIPAMASTLPLLLTRGSRSRTGLWAGITVYLVAGLVAVTSSGLRSPFIISPAVAQIPRIETVLARHHVTVGYAGYWTAASVEWSSHEKLHIAPLKQTAGTVAPMFSMRVASWYRPRPATPSYLLLAQGDPTLADRQLASLPRPATVVHVGHVTVDIWPYDIAAWLGPSAIAIPGITPAVLSRARQRERPRAGR